MAKETTMTIEQIESLLVAYPDSPFYCRQHLVIPNVDWGFLNHEADLLIVSKAGYLTEVEIKRTWADFKADFKKKHTHYDSKLSHFYYAVPEKIAQKVFDFLYVGKLDISNRWSRSKVDSYTEVNVNKCGLIVYKDPDEFYKFGNYCITVGATNMGDYKISDEEEKKLLRLLGLRVWSLKNKISKLQIKINENENIKH